VGLVHASNQSLSKIVYFESTGRDTVDYLPANNWAPQNVGETRNKGWEATSQSNWGPYKLRLSAVMQNPWSVTYDEALSRRAKQYGSADMSRNWQGYEVGVRMYGTGERKNSHYDSYMLSGYSLWSLYLNHQLDKEWTAQFKIDNVLDRQYQLAYGYNTPGRGVYTTLRYQPKP
jgi:vitamin B12 transporter